MIMLAINFENVLLEKRLTYSDGRLAILDLEVVRSDNVSQTTFRHVARKRHCTERGTGLRKVGGRREGSGLLVDNDYVSIEKKEVTFFSLASMGSLMALMKGWATYR